MEEENKLVQASDFITASFCPAMDMASADDLRTTQDMVSLMLLQGVDVAADLLNQLLVESGFRKELLGGDQFWLLKRR